MGKFRSLIKIAVVSGPAVIQTVMRYGPTIKKLVESNPAVVSRMTSRLQGYQSAQKKTGIAGAERRIEVLREQVNYLYGSANTPEVAQRAVAWKAALNKLEASLPLIDVMPTKEKRRQLRKINDRIGEVSGEILAAVVEDDIEDAIILDEDPRPENNNE